MEYLCERNRYTIMPAPKKSKQERIDEIDRKIADLENRIDALKAKREEIANPVTYQDVLKAAKKKNISPKKIAETFGLEIPPKDANPPEEEGGEESHPEGEPQEG